MIKNRGQFSVDILLECFMDSSSDVEESETSVRTRLRVPSGVFFGILFDILICL